MEKDLNEAKSLQKNSDEDVKVVEVERRLEHGGPLKKAAEVVQRADQDGLVVNLGSLKKIVEVPRRPEQVWLVEKGRRPANSGSPKRTVEPPSGAHRKPHLPAWVVRPMGGLCKPPAELSDEELYQKCRECGQNAKEWSRKFAALLPEVAKRGLHRRRGFVSIGEFAGKVAGMSEYAVDRIFQLYAKIKDKPCLLKLFESGAVGWSKIAKVAYVATVETDKLWAEKVPILSMAALEVLVQNYRRKSVLKNTAESGNLFSQWAVDGEALRRGVVLGGAISSGPVGEAPGSGGMNYSCTSLSGGTNVSSMSDPPGEAQFQNLLGPAFEPPVRFSFPASREVEFDLRLAKQKLEKQTKQVLSWNETFQLMIQKSEIASGQSKTSIAARGEGLCESLCKNCLKKAATKHVCDECYQKSINNQENK